ncbi:hypothetical protein X971_1089 [Agrobacterium tumefaciens LBA4213 (Ach5)]|nr:hypothetical protein X971_1089 [Agrobacterium tumefaciens LBA4213 (Ach5)]
MIGQMGRIIAMPPLIMCTCQQERRISGELRKMLVIAWG